MSIYIPTTSKKPQSKASAPAQASERENIKLYMYKLESSEHRLAGSLEILECEQQVIDKQIKADKKELDELVLLEKLEEFVSLIEDYANKFQSIAKQGEQANSIVTRNLQCRMKERALKMETGFNMVANMIETMK